ncbi:OLC1v1011112C1 [Oldenlandia corymbosa var. corymbosa]|uniref:OLC1v1011112C1 n=1 Tax=Oldenlandia corymbosa var. corymbosa TaxID=529605 RepID=A0AAV1DV98_OLDCO|nr:OLC1v1011112C1 [Oldenlandia corymbosa var. corymbosa]
MGGKDKNKKRKPKSDNGGKDGKLITDPRFASVHSDPRFREPPKHKSKVTIDSRFSSVFTDKKFATSKAPTDKRGKPKKKGDAAASNPLKRYYRLEDEKKGKLDEKLLSDDEESDSEDLKVKRKDESKESSTSEEEEEEEVESDGSSSTSASSTDSDEEDDVVSDDEEEEEEEEKIPEIDKETHRLAVMNMDWSEVRAVDLYVLLSSFLPKGGHLKSVAVYPSEFGLKRMEEEAIHGPLGLFESEENKNGGDDSDQDDDDDDEIDDKKLRAYEKSKLRYYYAVAEFDSVATADYLYKNYDGMEFERSSTKLDLRFIPDSLEFKHPPRDVAKNAPADYEGLDFHTRALQHSKIHLTWDEDEPQRVRTLKRKFNADQLAELELQEFLASDVSESSASEEDDEMQDGSAKKQKKRDMYRALIQSGDGSDASDEEENQDMEVTFNTGLEDLSKRILEKKDRESETVWEAHLRKKREKKKARKNRAKDSSEDESSDTDQEPGEEPDDFFVEEPSARRSKHTEDGKGRNTKQNEEDASTAEASRAELELLLAPDNNGASNSDVKGYNLKRKKLKGKKGKEILNDDKLPTADYDDPRFSALFTSPDFALDPTDPQFKRYFCLSYFLLHLFSYNMVELFDSFCFPLSTLSCSFLISLFFFN